MIHELEDWKEELEIPGDLQLVAADLLDLDRCMRIVAPVFNVKMEDPAEVESVKKGTDFSGTAKEDILWAALLLLEVICCTLLEPLEKHTNLTYNPFNNTILGLKKKKQCTSKFPQFFFRFFPGDV